jgi:hypothetical protein
MRNYLLALRRRLDYFDLLAVAALLLSIAIISGIFYTYDVTRQTVRDDARAETRLNNQQLPDNLKLIDKEPIIAFKPR